MEGFVGRDFLTPYLRSGFVPPWQQPMIYGRESPPSISPPIGGVTSQGQTNCAIWIGKLFVHVGMLEDLVVALPKRLQDQVNEARLSENRTPAEVMKMISDPEQRKRLKEMLETLKKQQRDMRPAPSFYSIRTIAAMAWTDMPLFMITMLRWPIGPLFFIWTMFMLSPKPVLKILCMIFRWPTPQTFDSAVVSHNAALQGLVGTILLRSFNITDKDRIPVHTKR